MASDMAFMAADLYSSALYDCMLKLGRLQEGSEVKWKRNTDGSEHLPVGPSVMIHDSVKGEAPFEFFLLNLHLLEWAMTVGLVDWIESHYDFEVGMKLAAEIEIGADWSSKETWNWTKRGLTDILVRTVDKHRKIHGSALKSIKGKKSKEIVKSMFSDFDKQKKILKVNKYYPLNV